jgi:glycosyltransferase involved in cell wall biosynthesis
MTQETHITSAPAVAVSVIVPAYNAESFITETIESVIAQTLQNWELIIVDDGSTDKTVFIAEQFCSDARITVIRQKNAGVSAARNAGLLLAKGRYVAFLDADDVWLPENLVQKLSLLELPENSSAVLAHAAVENIDSNSKRSGEINAGKSGHVLNDLLSWNGTVVPGPSSIVVRRAAAEKIGGFDIDLSTAADQDFFFRLAELGPFAAAPEVLSLYRLHPNNMHRNIARMESDHIRVYEKAKQRNAFSDSRFRRKCFAKLYLILAGSWWKNGSNKLRGLKFMLKAVLVYPPSFFQLIKKIG